MRADRKSVREEWQECLEMLFSNMSKAARRKGYHRSWKAPKRGFYGPYGEIVFLKIVDESFYVVHAFIGFIYEKHKRDFSYNVSYDAYIIPMVIFPQRGTELSCHVVESPAEWVCYPEEGWVPEPTAYMLPRGCEQEVIDLFKCFLNLMDKTDVIKRWGEVVRFACPDIDVMITFCVNSEVFSCSDYLRTFTRYVFCPVMFYKDAYARVLLGDLINFIR